MSTATGSGTRLRYLRDVVTLEMDTERCTGCRLCAVVCPHAVFAIAEGKARVADRDACMECGACARNCPAGAVTVSAGVGCAAAVLGSKLRRRGEPSCGCSGDGPVCCG